MARPPRRARAYDRPQAPASKRASPPPPASLLLPLQGMTLKAMAALLPDLEEEGAGRVPGQYGLDDLADE